MSTTTTTLNDIINPAGVERLILGAHVPPTVAMQVAWSAPMPAGHSSVVVPRRDGITTNSGTKTENATFAAIASNTSGTTVTGGMVGHRAQLAWEANAFTLEDSLSLVIQDGVEALYQRIDTDLMTAASGAANSSDNGTNALTEAMVLDFVAAYNAQVPHAGQHALVLYPHQIADWSQDINTNGGNQLGGDAESERIAKIAGVGMGYKGARFGLAVFESSNVVVAAGEASGFGCKMGEGGGLALRTAKPVSVESEWQPTSQSWDVVVCAHFGTAVVDPANIRTLISASA